MVLLGHLLLLMMSRGLLIHGRQFALSQSEESSLEDSLRDNPSLSNDAADGPSLGDWDTDSQSDNSIFDPQQFKRETEHVDWDKVIDNVLEVFRKKTTQEIALPDLHKSYSVPIVRHIVPYFPSLTLDATQGYLRSVHSIHRLGHATVSGQTLTATFQFGSLRLHYEDFKALVLKVGPHGRLDAVVGDNALRVRARIERSGGMCRLLYEDVEKLHLDMVKLNMTGLGPLNRFYSYISTKVLSVLKDCVTNSMERFFAVKIRNMFENYPFPCE